MWTQEEGKAGARGPAGKPVIFFFERPPKVTTRVRMSADASEEEETEREDRETRTETNVGRRD